MSREKPAVLAIIGAGIVGILASVHFLSKKAGAIGILPEDGGDDEPGSPEKESTPQEKAIFEGAAAIMRQAGEKVMGRPLNDYELQVCLGVAKLETSFGKWSGAMAGSNNWGAVQCTSRDNPGECSPWTDSTSDGKRYDQPFKRYPTPLDGAADVVRKVFKDRKEVLAAVSSNRPTVYRFAIAMRRTSYYGSWCLKTVKKYGSTGGQQAQKNPVTEVQRSCEHEAVELYAKQVLDPILAKLAPALGLKRLPMGDFLSARDWYESTQVTKKPGGAVVSGLFRDMQQGIIDAETALQSEGKTLFSARPAPSPRIDNLDDSVFSILDDDEGNGRERLDWAKVFNRSWREG
jgi:hypothetical protein